MDIVARQGGEPRLTPLMRWSTGSTQAMARWSAKSLLPPLPFFRAEAIVCKGGHETVRLEFRALLQKHSTGCFLVR